MNFLPLFSSDGAVELNLVALLFVGGLSILSVVELIKRSLFKENDGVSTRRIFSWVMILFTLYVGYRVYPTYYRNALYEKMAQSIAALSVEERLRFSRVNILKENSKLSMGDTLGFSSLARQSMQEMPFRSLLASLHPNSSTTPIMVGAVFPIFASFEERGGNYGLALRFGDSAPLFPKVRYRLRVRSEFVEVLNRNEIIAQFDRMAGRDNGGLDLLGGTICASQREFLLITETGCGPYGEQTKVEFVLRDLRAEWQLVHHGGRLFLLAPRFYQRGKDDFMAAIMRQALEATGNKGRIVGGEPLYMLGSNLESGATGMWMQTNREVLQGSRIELDGRTVLEMVGREEMSEHWIAYFESPPGRFDLNEEMATLRQINVRLVLQNNALDNPEPYDVHFDIDINESFRSAAAHFLELLKSQ